MPLDENSGELSTEEVNLLQNAQILISKQLALKKLEHLLAATQEEIRHCLQSSGVQLPPEVAIKAGKISRGENYRQLPYLVLDYPRYFKPESTFACRSLFWWGNDFSCTVLLQGDMAEHFRGKLLQQAETLRASDWWLGIHSSPWEHHFEADNVCEASAFSTEALEAHLSTHPFIKLTRRLPLQKYSSLPAFCGETFGMFLALISP